MSKCCSLPHGGNPPTCPINGHVTRPVSRKTLESLLKPEAKGNLRSEPYYFCDGADCDAVYVSALGDHIVRKDQLLVRVGAKEKDDPIPLCYCFGFDRRAVRDDVKAMGRTEIPEAITRRIRAGECRCEEANPSGGCCLGAVYRSIKQAEILKAKGEL